MTAVPQSPAPSTSRSTRHRSDAAGDRRVARRHRASLGLRLRLLDVEPRICIRRGAAGVSSRLPPQLLPLFARLSRHTGAPGAGAWARSRRVVPRDCLSPASRPGRRDARPDLVPRDDRRGLSHVPGRGTDAATAGGHARSGLRCAPRASPDYAGHGCRSTRRQNCWRSRSAWRRLGPHDYLANTVRHLDALGIRDGLLHRIAARVAGLAADPAQPK